MPCATKFYLFILFSPASGVLATSTAIVGRLSCIPSAHFSPTIRFDSYR